jgi:hypothetical protein
MTLENFQKWGRSLNIMMLEDRLFVPLLYTRAIKGLIFWQKPKIYLFIF